MSDPPTVYGPFIRLTKTTYVRYDAILVIRDRSQVDDQGGVHGGSEVVVRPTSNGGGPPVWAEHTAQDIIDAILAAKAADE